MLQTVLTGLFTPEEINTAIRIVTEFAVFIFATSVGSFTRGLVYPDENNFKQNLGLTFLATLISFTLNQIFKETITMAFTFIMSASLGFFIPAFKNWFKDKTLFKILFNVLRKTSDTTTTIIEEVGKELDKDDKNDKN